MTTMAKLIGALRTLVLNPREFWCKLKALLGARRRARVQHGQADIGALGLSDIFPESALAHEYCRGKGLEIGGSAHNPFGLDTLNVDVDGSMDTVFKKEEVRLCGRALKVDIVASGDAIPLPDEGQDFVVSSHVIEHFPNPIKALLEWDRLVKPGGVIFMIVPHKERTFDKDAPLTSVEHLVKDFENDTTESGGQSPFHDHCWITETFVEFVRHVIDHFGLKWEIAEVQDVDDKVGNGFTLVVRKQHTRDAAAAVSHRQSQ
jgi:SAM-dependent methyltransferase